MGIIIVNRNILFAEDTSLIAKGRDLTTATEDARKDILCLKEWLGKNKLKLNESKIKNVTISICKEGGHGVTALFLGVA